MATIAMAINSNVGYTAAQARNDLTLRDLLTAVEEAIEQYGDGARIVTADDGNRYGANWGNIDQWRDLFTPTSATAGDYVCGDCYDETDLEEDGLYVDLDADVDLDEHGDAAHPCTLCGEYADTRMVREN